MSDSATSFQLSLTNSFWRSLACAAIAPGLRSILLFDNSFETLRLAAKTTAQMLESVTGNSVLSVTLGTFESEDVLWGSLGLGSESKEQLLQWQPGLLANDSRLQLIVIPDLTKLSLAAARACVVLMGANVAHLERHGQQAYWQPNLCWLASCASSEVGMVSPHLLDRFALRLSGRLSEEVETTKDRVAEIIELIDDQTDKQDLSSPRANIRQLKEFLQKALQYQPKVTTEATARILDYASQMEVNSQRREIALARLSLAHARLEDADEMSANDVDAAAQMIGLKLISKKIEKPANLATSKSEDLQPSEETQSTPEIGNPEFQSHTVSETVPVYQPNATEVSQATELTVTINPYPEDTAPIEREIASLRLPTRRFHSKTAPRGVIIGVEKATTLQDIALVRTLLEAAKFQPIRPKPTANSQQQLILSPTDLYSYRRVPVAEQMLTLVLDHTCLQNCNWQEELLPYLSWAYVERASICLIQVGAADASHELQAERVMAQNILVPRISARLEAGGGKATPLAHGLDLALQTLRHALQHGRNNVQQAILVVISDGRGNVPLEASRSDRIIPPIGRKGVEDALQVAERIRGLNEVKAVLFNPQSRQYPELPLELAKALGAKVILIPLQQHGSQNRGE